jgi:hypothetical protein
MIRKNDEGCLRQALSFQSSAILSILTTITPSNSDPLKGSSQPPSSVTPKMASVVARSPYLQRMCVRPDDRAIPSRRCSNTGKISPRKFQKILSHSCPSGQSWSTVRTAHRLILPDAHSNPQTINRVLGHLELQEFGVNSIRA